MGTPEIIALVIGLVTLSIGIPLAVLQSISERVRHLENQLLDILQEQTQYNLAIQAIGKCLLLDDSFEVTQESVIIRLLTESNSPREINERIINIFENNRIDKERAINEVLVFSKTPEVKISAFKTLCNQCGDANSIPILEKAISNALESDKVLLHKLIEELANRCNRMKFN